MSFMARCATPRISARLFDQNSVGCDASTCPTAGRRCQRDDRDSRASASRDYPAAAPRHRRRGGDRGRHWACAPTPVRCRTCRRRAAPHRRAAPARSQDRAQAAQPVVETRQRIVDVQIELAPARCRRACMAPPRPPGDRLDRLAEDDLGLQLLALRALESWVMRRMRNSTRAVRSSSVGWRTTEPRRHQVAHSGSSKASSEMSLG